MDQIFLGEFAYPGLSRAYPGRCGLAVWRQAGEAYAVVIASELKENPGTSITNAYELLAAHVVRQLWPQVLPWGTLWFEHYPSKVGPDKVDSYDLVTFALVKQMDAGPVRYAHPSWRRMPRAWVAGALDVTPEHQLIPWETPPDTGKPKALEFAPGMCVTDCPAITVLR